MSDSSSYLHYPILPDERMFKMSEQNQIQRKKTNEIQTVNDLTNKQASVVPVEQQFGLSLEGLTDEQQQALRYKMLQSCVDLKIDAIDAQNRTVITSAEMNQTIQTVNSLSQTKAEFSVSSEHKTATGSTNIKVSNYKNTSMWIVIAIIGVVLILALAKGC
jgi:hypothetical protein